ncbi:hypothetical protein WA026_006136 [Henosepilachna vigintioctopunctata]|uniref:Cytokine-like nuclear factor N-PAC n=1 Tax=Henosepilachna vigintioctopunctata TaxID=420089 RepID=A0AAW1THW9_9CUCU
MSGDYQIGDLVWAKMKGSPDWPGQVAKPLESANKSSKKNARWIYFFGSDNYAWIRLDNLKPFYAFQEKLSSASKLTSFKDAVKKIEDYIENKKKDPNYVLPMPSFKEKKESADDSQKEQKKAAKRMSKDASMLKSPPSTIKKVRRSTPKYEENGSHSALGEELAALPASDSFRDSPSLELNNLGDSPRNVSENISCLAFGFIGLGVMGTGIVKNLIAAGHRINLWNRTSDKCEEIKKTFKFGLVQVYEAPCDVVYNSDIIFSCVSDAIAAGSIIYDKFGVLSVDSALEGKGYVEMTGIGPDISMGFCEAIQNKGGRYLEAQLQGSKKEAEEGNLVVLAAGDESIFEKCQPCFKAMGKTVFYLGNVGYAAKMNMVVNLINSISMMGLAEALSLADRSGLSLKNVWDILSATGMACPYLEGKADKIIRRDFQQSEHALQYMQKDVKLCLDLSDNLKQPLIFASIANEILKHTRRLGYDGQDCSCVYMKLKF